MPGSDFSALQLRATGAASGAKRAPSPIGAARRRAAQPCAIARSPLLQDQTHAPAPSAITVRPTMIATAGVVRLCAARRRPSGWRRSDRSASHLTSVVVERVAIGA